VILNPWVIAMYVSLLGMSALYLYAWFIAFQIVKRWDASSMEDGQLILERRSHLAATIIQYGFWIQVMSLVLFYMALESVSELIPGAMCATGSLQANTFGFPSLFVKVAVTILCVLWLSLHHVDSRLEDYRLTPLKFKCLLFLAPLVVVDLVFQFFYFVNLDPEIISSCCGVVFEIEGKGLGASVASLPASPMMIAFYGAVPFLLLVGLVFARKATPWGYYTYTGLGILFFLLSILAIISFMSPYVYEAPTLHCPFCLMRQEYNYIGYPLYLLLFGAFLFSLLPGLFELLKRKGTVVSQVVRGLQRKALHISLVLWALFVFVPTLIIVFYEMRSGAGYLFG
jgi:hypothetical protein